MVYVCTKVSCEIELVFFNLPVGRKMTIKFTLTINIHCGQQGAVLIFLNTVFYMVFSDRPYISTNFHI